MAAEMDGQAMVTEARLGSIGTRRKKAAPEPRAPQIFLTSCDVMIRGLGADFAGPGHVCRRAHRQRGER